MRNEAALRERPQELVELARFVVGRRVDEDVVVELRRLVDDLAGEPQASIVGVAVEDVEVDLRHCPPAFRRIVDEQRHGPASRALVRVRAPRDAGDVEMRPRQPVDESRQEVRADARAAVARAGVREVREVAAQRLAVFLVNGQPPREIERAIGGFEQGAWRASSSLQNRPV